VTFPPLTQSKLVLDLATPERCKAALTQLAGYIPRWYTRPKMVTHPSTKWALRGLTSFMRRTPLTTTPRRQLEWPPMSFTYCESFQARFFVAVDKMSTDSASRGLSLRHLGHLACYHLMTETLVSVIWWKLANLSASCTYFFCVKSIWFCCSLTAFPAETDYLQGSRQCQTSPSVWCCPWWVSLCVKFVLAVPRWLRWVTLSIQGGPKSGATDSWP